MLHAPELLILYALDMFLVLSIVTVLFDSSFPLAVPYFFQLLSIAGTGHMYVSQVFKEMFSLESRFWYSFFFLGVMILSAFAISAYLLYVKKSYAKGLMFSGSFSIPSMSFGIYLMTFYNSYEATPVILRFFNGYSLLFFLLLSGVITLMGFMLFTRGHSSLRVGSFNLRKIVRGFLDLDKMENIQGESVINQRVRLVEKPQTRGNVTVTRVKSLPEYVEPDYDNHACLDHREKPDDNGEKYRVLKSFEQEIKYPPVDEEFYWGNLSEKIFHKQSCHLAENIKQENRRMFFSVFDALDAGFRECKICKP